MILQVIIFTIHTKMLKTNVLCKTIIEQPTAILLHQLVVSRLCVCAARVSYATLYPYIKPPAGLCFLPCCANLSN